MPIFGKTPASRITDIDALLQILDLVPTSIIVKDGKLNFVFSNACSREDSGAARGRAGDYIQTGRRRMLYSLVPTY
jgi:hypothetical protein